MVQGAHHGVCLFNGRKLRPFRLNAKAPGDERVLRNFDDIVAFILMRVEIRFCELPCW
jgi:hypothetical protein